MLEKMRGSITVLLALVLVPVLALSNILLEIGRYRSARAILDEAVFSSAMSVLGYFDEELYTRFALFAMDKDEVDVSLFTEYMKGNSNDGLNNLSQMYGDITTDFSTMYNLGNPYVLKNQIMQAEEYRGIVTIMKDREPLEAMEELIAGSFDKNTMLELERFDTTVDFSKALGKFGENLADMVDKAGELETQIKKVQEVREELLQAIADYEASDDEEDEEDGDEGTTAEDVEAARDTYCSELEGLLSSIDSYIRKHDGLVSSINTCSSKLAAMVSKYQASVDAKGDETSGGEAADAVSQGFKAFQEKYESYPVAKYGITQLRETKKEIDKVLDLIEDASADYLVSLPDSNFVVTVQGNIARDNWEELLVITVGENIQANLLETIGQMVWVLSYVVPGTDRNNYQFNNRLDSETYSNCYERNPSVETGLSGKDEAYIAEMLEQTRDAADQLHYDLSRLTPSARTSNLPAMDDMDRLINNIVSNMMKIIEFISQVLHLLDTTSLNDVFLLAYKLVKLVGKAIEAFVAALALVGQLLILVQRLDTFLQYMKQSLAEGFYINTYAVSMFPNRTNAITGESVTGIKYGSRYLPTMSELEAASISYGMSTGLGQITNDLLNSWGMETPAAPKESDQFGGACAEYIICGNQSEYVNQVNVYDRIFMLRALANLPAFFSNKTTLEVLKVPYIGPILFLVWYIAECNLDMKFLTMSEQKLPLIKTGDRIFLSPDGMKQVAKNIEKADSAIKLSPKAAFNQIVTPVKSATDTGEAIDRVLGFNYTDYCWLLMCMVSNQTKVNRIGDLVEMEMQKQKRGFSMRTADTCIRVEVDASYHMVLPAVMSTEQSVDGLRLHSLRFVGY